MVAGLLDTNVVVDLLRGYSLAQSWIQSQTDLGVTRVVFLEAVEGARNNQDLRKTLRLLKQFDLVEITTLDLEWATRRLIRYRLSHHVDAFDCLIAAPAYRLQLPLYTQNLKHFTPLLGSLAQQPY